MWKPVKGYEGLYQISDQGEVWSVPKHIRCSDETWLKTGGEMLTPLKNPETGYHTVRLSFAGDWEQKYVHRLVLKTFVGLPPTENHQADHINGDKGDNRLSNLQWLTPSKNQKKAFSNDLEDEKKTVIAQVKWLSQNLKLKCKAVAEEFDGVSKHQVSYWGNNQGYKLVKPIKPPKEIIDRVKRRSLERARFKVLPKSDIQKLKWLWNRRKKIGASPKKMSELFDIGRTFLENLDKTYSFDEKQPSTALIEKSKL